MDILQHRNPDDMRYSAENVPDTAISSHSTTKNALFTCYLCWRHAEHEYDTTPCFLGGVFYPSETRRLCKLHWRQVWQVMLESLYNRVQISGACDRRDVA